MFSVDCTWLKSTLETIFNSVHEATLEYFRNEAHEDLKLTSSRFGVIRERLEQVPSNPQELASLTEYVQKVNIELSSLQQKIDAVVVSISYLQIALTYLLNNRENMDY